jgi:LPXTG-motif cell wall-anchored protein
LDTYSKTFEQTTSGLVLGVLLLISAGCTLLIKKKKQVNDLNYMKAIELQKASS